MRVFKFRAWDEEKGVFYKFTHFLAAMNLFSWRELIAPVIKRQLDVCIKEKCEPDFIQEFTGLKDSKGVDIFEGDIVRINTWCYIVRYYISEFRFYAGNGGLDSLSYDLGEMIVEGPMVVVGNVFSHSVKDGELVKKK